MGKNAKQQKLCQIPSSVTVSLSARVYTSVPSRFSPSVTVAPMSLGFAFDRCDRHRYA